LNEVPVVAKFFSDFSPVAIAVFQGKVCQPIVLLDRPMGINTVILFTAKL
jgi:hypothetical protein